MDNKNFMAQGKVSHIIIKMALPTMIAMVLSSVYSLVDTFFIKDLGQDATAAIGLNIALEQLITLCGSFFAVGATSFMARLLGANDEKCASKVLSTAFFGALIVGSLLLVFGLVFINPLVSLFGARAGVLDFALIYSKFSLYSAPFTSAGFVLAHCLRCEGKPIYSMVGMVLGGILNIILDPIFILKLDLGMAGAGLASLLSKIISFIFLLIPYIIHKTRLNLSYKNISLEKKIVKEISLMGLPSFFRTSLAMVSQICLNNLASSYGSSYLAGIGLVSRIMAFPANLILGLGQGFMPVAGFSWGGKDFKRSLECYKFTAKFSLCLTSLISLGLIMFSGFLIGSFSNGDKSMEDIGKLCLISQSLALPFGSFVVVVNMLYSAFGKPKAALFLSICRQGICFLPLVFALERICGIIGIGISQGLGDAISFLITIPFALAGKKLVKDKMNEI